LDYFLRELLGFRTGLQYIHTAYPPADNTIDHGVQLEEKEREAEGLSSKLCSALNLIPSVKVEK
jgi:hypothetical protein